MTYCERGYLVQFRHCLSFKQQIVLEQSAMSEEKKPQLSELKKQSSYTYWVDENNKSRDLPEEHRPKKVSPPPNTEPTPTVGPSKWNTLGSWEQRAVPMKELNEAVEAGLQVWLIDQASDLQLKEVSLQGELKQIFSNGKKKLLYEISGKLKFEGEELEIKLEELTCSGDREWKAAGKKKEEREKLSKVGGKLVQALVGVINRYKE